MTALAVPPGLAWELVLVDNGDARPVAPVAAEFDGRLPVRVCAEPIPGISRARNRGADTAAGDHIIWTDDDVEVAPNWLAAYAEAFAKWPAASFFGGSASPLFEAPEVAWMDRFQGQLGPMLAMREPAADTEIDADDLPYGLNLATRTAVVRQFRFDTRLGRAPDQQIAGEETDLLRRLLAAGHRGRWVPRARVSHVIPAIRQTEKYLYDYYVAAGQEFVVRDRVTLLARPGARAKIRLKAAVLSLARFVPLNCSYGVSLRRAHAYNLGAAALLKDPAAVRRVPQV